MYFQDLILELQKFWANRGCVSGSPTTWKWGRHLPPGHVPQGPGTRAWNAAYVQPSRRPTDGRYGENPNRLQHYYQFQVIMKPSPLESRRSTCRAS